MTDTSPTPLSPHAEALQAAIDEATREFRKRESEHMSFLYRRQRNVPHDEDWQNRYLDAGRASREAAQKLKVLTDQMTALEINARAAAQKALVERALQEDASQYADFSEKELNAAREYLDMASGAMYPKGTFYGGFWEPSEDNCLSCCEALALPTRLEFRSKTLYAHCQSAKHLAMFHGVDRVRMLKAAKVLERLEPSLPEITIETGHKSPPETQEMTEGGAIVLPSERQLISGWRMRLIRQAEYWIGVFEERLSRHRDGGTHKTWAAKQAAKKAVLLDELGRWKQTRQLLEPGSLRSAWTEKQPLPLLPLSAFQESHQEITWEQPKPAVVVSLREGERFVVGLEESTVLGSYGPWRSDELAQQGIDCCEQDAHSFARGLLDAVHDRLSIYELQHVVEVFAAELQQREAERQAAGASVPKNS